MRDGVAAVLADGFERHWGLPTNDPERLSSPSSLEHATVALAALTDAGYAVVSPPEGVAVEHGARLVSRDGVDHNGVWRRRYTIEPPSEA